MNKKNTFVLFIYQRLSALFWLIAVVCVLDIFVQQNLSHRQTVMSGYITSVHFTVTSFIMISSHCLSPLHVSPCCCFFLHSPVFYFSTRVVLEKRGKLLSLLCAFFLPPCTPFPLSLPSCSLSILPPSTLMRRRMTMNTPIIMRKQQAFPPPLHPFLPKHGAPISR